MARKCRRTGKVTTPTPGPAGNWLQNIFDDPPEEDNDDDNWFTNEEWCDACMADVDLTDHPEELYCQPHDSSYHNECPYCEDEKGLVS